MSKKLTKEQRYIANDIIGRVLSKEKVNINLKDFRHVEIVRITGTQYISGYSKEVIEIDDLDEFERFCNKLSYEIESYMGKNKYEIILEEIDDDN